MLEVLRNPTTALVVFRLIPRPQDFAVSVYLIQFCWWSQTCQLPDRCHVKVGRAGVLLAKKFNKISIVKKKRLQVYPRISFCEFLLGQSVGCIT